MARKSTETLGIFDPTATDAPVVASTEPKPETETDFRIHPTLDYFSGRPNYFPPKERLGIKGSAAETTITVDETYSKAVADMVSAVSALFPKSARLSAEAHTSRAGCVLTLVVRADPTDESDELLWDAIPAPSLVKAVETATSYALILGRKPSADSTVYPDPAVSARYVAHCDRVRARLALTTARISAYLSAEPSAYLRPVKPSA